MSWPRVPAFFLNEYRTCRNLNLNLPKYLWQVVTG